MKRWMWIAAAALGIVALAVFLPGVFSSLQTPQAGETLLSAAEGLDEIVIDAVFDPDSRTLAVSQTFTLVNRTGSPQPELILRTYAAAMRDEEYAPSATEELYDLSYPDGFSAAGLRLHLKIWTIIMKMTPKLFWLSRLNRHGLRAKA